ncbi:sigma-54 interaction domain-containing protein [Thiohalorhabdus sp. Cl-TMA]|uniref:Sigma-54 interaction domain-containing protein n=1 Tax=Thiohalorhabdus methylotrophus TaxID=3242694 RepID=A0ABV4TY53_9GAMM
MSREQTPKILLIGFPSSAHGELADVCGGAGGRPVFLDGVPEGGGRANPDCAFLDGDGLDGDLPNAVTTLVERDIAVGVVVTRPDPEQARSLGQAGAEDYRPKPLTAEVVRALLPDEAVPAGAGEFVTASPGMQRLLEQVRKLARSDGPGLLCGSSGTGKERLAGFVHQSSPRYDGPLVAVNCAALPVNLLESELFGHEKGAFTGADQRRDGRFQEAHNGTLLLDEVTEMPVDMQAKLLRVLQEGMVNRVGGGRPEPVDVRVLATTNRDPDGAVQDGRLRADLLYRLSVLRVRLPDLEQRSEDIPVLAEHFVQLYARRYGRRIEGLDRQAREHLQGRRWPGNVRELENAIHRAVVLAEDGYIGLAHLQQEELSIDAVGAPPEEPVKTAEAEPEGTGDSQAGPGATAAVLPEEDLTIREMEDLLIERTLERVDGNRTRAAELLGISIRTLRNKLNQKGGSE